MSAPLYRDVYGELHEKAEIDRHHVIPRCKAKGRHQRRFINSYGLVLPMLKVWHNEGDNALHNNVPLPNMPSDRFRSRLEAFMREDDTVGVYDKFFAISGFVHDLALDYKDTQVEREAARLSFNLEQQGAFILQGMVEVVYE